MRVFIMTVLTGFVLAVMPLAAQAEQGQYYLVENGQQTGPHSLETIAIKAQQGQITKQSLVWKSGMAEWGAAGLLPELAIVWSNEAQPPQVPENTPPTLPTNEPTPSSDPKLDQLAEQERRDMGVPASDQLHTGAFHGPTPNSIPGGQLVTTKGLTDLVQRQIPYALFDVLGGEEMLPGAIDAVQAAQPGTFQDAIQQKMDQFLTQLTGGKKDTPLVFYCLSVECWMSYNASLRAINLGYTNVLWYRGGIEAWKAAGLQTVRRGQMQQGGQQPQQFMSE